MVRSVASEKAGNEEVNDHTAELVTPGKSELRGFLSTPRTIDPGEVLRYSTGMLITQEDAEEEREIAASGWSLTPITPLVVTGRRPTKLSVGQGTGDEREAMVTERL